MSRRHRSLRPKVFVPELGSVRVRGFSVADMPVSSVPDEMPPADRVSARHPALLELVSQGVVSHRLTTGDVARLSDESLELLSGAILRAHPVTARMLAAAVEGGG